MAVLMIPVTKWVIENNVSGMMMEQGKLVEDVFSGKVHSGGGGPSQLGWSKHA